MSLSLPEPDNPAAQAPPPQALQQPASGYDQLQCLQDVLDDFPRLLTELQDPKHVEMAVAAMKTLASIQSQLMSGNGSQPQG